MISGTQTIYLFTGQLVADHTPPTYTPIMSTQPTLLTA